MSAISARIEQRALHALSRSAALAWRPQLSSEALIVLCSLFFSLFSNAAFWHAAIGNPLAQWRLVVSLFLIVTALHAFLLGWVFNRWTAKPLMTILLLATAAATYYMSAYGVYLDADMLRNVLHTDRQESSELLTLGLLAALVLGASHTLVTLLGSDSGAGVALGAASSVAAMVVPVWWTVLLVQVITGRRALHDRAADTMVLAWHIRPRRR